MCMATLIPAGIPIPWDGLENGSITNDDGHGFAIASKQYGLEVFHSMDFDVTKAALVAAREKHGIGSTVLFHSRFGTHGEMGLFNVHPFFVPGTDNQTVMAHNGILDSKYHPGKSDRRSDTRIFVDRVAADYCENPNGVPSRKKGGELGRAIGSGNKLVFLSVKSGKPKARIVNPHLGEFKHGVWFSNSGYCDIGYKWRGWRNDWWGDGYSHGGSYGVGDRKVNDEDWSVTCSMCRNGDVSIESMHCHVCNHCLDCEKHFPVCDCIYVEGVKIWSGLSFKQADDLLYQHYIDEELTYGEYEDGWDKLYTHYRKRGMILGDPGSGDEGDEDLWTPESSSKELVLVGSGMTLALARAIDENGPVKVTENGWVQFENGVWKPAELLT